MLSSRVRASSGEVGGRIVGKHVYGNLYGCDNRLVSNERYLRKVAREAVKVAGMHLVELKSWRFESKKGGISVMALVTESHIAIHTWPDYEYATVDVYTCGEQSRPEVAFDYIVEKLSPREYTKHFADRSSSSVSMVIVKSA